MTPELQAWCDGIMAHEGGVTANPHAEDSILAYEWHRGWLIADVLLTQRLKQMAVEYVG